MENKTTRGQILNILFATHPKTDKFFLTSDDQAFFAEHDANSHAKTLENKEVQPYTRLVAEAIEAIKEKIAAKSATKPEKDKTTISEKETLLARYEVLYGKKANHLTGIDKLKLAISEKEVLNAADDKEAEEKAAAESANKVESEKPTVEPASTES